MDFVKPLPTYLIQRYHGWFATGFSQNQALYKRLVIEGQRPRAMIISCCDSRVHATSIFGAEPGEFFIHRNIANLVPPYSPNGSQNGTSAAVEYAVTALNVSQLIILGHSNCGGVKGFLDMCRGHARHLEEKTSFVGVWMDVLRPGYEAIKNHSSEEEIAQDLEKQAVLTSLINLMTFPFVEKAVQDGSLSLHGLWTDIAEGSLEAFDPASQTFKPVQAF